MRSPAALLARSPPITFNAIVDLQLRDKTALITGSTKGIGLAIAKRLAAEGASVVLNGRDAEKTQASVDALKAEMPHAKVCCVAADVGTANGCHSLVEQLPEVDILINNAGVFEPVPFEETDDALWQRFYDVNVMSGVRLSRHYLPRMKAKEWGRIIFISSESGVQIPVEMIHYGMTKSAQLSLSRGLAETCAATGVTVNSVLPGPTASEGVLTFIEQMAEQNGAADLAQFKRDFVKEARPSSLIQRLATCDEVATLVTYVASPLSSATTGAALRVDGGVVKSMV